MLKCFNHIFFLKALISTWLMSLSIPFNLPLSPIISLFFIISLYCKKDMKLNSVKTYYKLRSNKIYVFYTLNLFIFFLASLNYIYTNDSNDILNYIFAAIYRGTLFLIIITSIVIHDEKISLKSIIDLSVAVGLFISILSLGNLLLNYLSQNILPAQNYTSSLIPDYNYFCLPILFAILGIFSKEVFKWRYLIILYLCSLSIYLSYSRRAFVLLNIILFMCFLFKKNLLPVQRLALALLLIVLNPMIELKSFNSFNKTLLTATGVNQCIWSMRSGDYQWRYLKILGVNLSIENVRQERLNTAVYTLPFISNFSNENCGNFGDLASVKSDYDTGGRLERWKKSFDYFYQSNLKEMILGSSFEYLNVFQRSFGKSKSIDYPHLIGASVLLYSGLIGLTAFISWISYTLILLLIKKSSFLLSTFLTFGLMSSISMDIPFSSYINIFIFTLPIFISSDYNIQNLPPKAKS